MTKDIPPTYEEQGSRRELNALNENLHSSNISLHVENTRLRAACGKFARRIRRYCKNDKAGYDKAIDLLCDLQTQLAAIANGGKP